ncbi:HXXEE domain-containing protein [Cohnella fermenti]
MCRVHIGFGLLIVIFSLMNCAIHIYTGNKYREWNPGLIMV